MKRQKKIDADINGKIYRKPFWINGCCHKKEEYVGSLVYSDGVEKDKKKIDVYVFMCSPGRQEVCIRYGNEGHEYCSPGFLVLFLSSSNLSYIYNKALYVMEFFGTVNWTRSKE